MSYSQPIVDHYQRISDNSWNATATTLADAFDVRVKKSIGDKTDVFQFKVPNANGQYSNTFTTGDKIDIYFLPDGATKGSSYLRINGIVRRMSLKVEGGNNYIMIDGVSYSEMITRGIAFYSATNQNSMQVIEGALISIARRNQNFQVTWDSSNPSTTAGGDAFPTLPNIHEFDVSMGTLIDRYLSEDFIGSERFYWYVSNDNKLSIRRRDADAATLTITEAEDPHSMDVTVDNTNVINWVIYKCGHKPNGDAIQDYATDDASMAKHGFKPYVLILNTANQMYQVEREANPTQLNTTDLYPSSYPYTTAWKSTGSDSNNSPNTTEGSSVTVNSAAEWNYAFEREAKWRGDARANEFLQLRNKGYLMANLELPANTQLDLGNIITFNSPSFAISSKDLRIEEVEYFDDNMKVKAREDIATI